jgi:ferrous iron transport protein B
MRDTMTLKDLEIGQSAKVIKVGGSGALRQHFLDMGIIPGAIVTMVKYAPISVGSESHAKTSSTEIILDANELETPEDESSLPVEENKCSITTPDAMITGKK